MQQKESLQEVKVPRGYKPVPNLFMCLPTKGESTYVGRYTNHTAHYSQLNNKICLELVEENKKKKRSIEELVDAINKKNEVFIKIVDATNSRQQKAKRHVYLKITEKRGIYSPKQKTKRA